MSDLSVMIEDIKLNIRVGALIEYNGKYLIEKDDTVDFAVPPGGRIKTLENSTVALIRELKEELGIDFSNEEFKLSAMIENFFEHQNKKYHELYFLYRVNLKGEYNIESGMINLDGGKSKYYLVDKNEFEKIKILPLVLKEIISNDNFKHYINNEIER